MALNENALTHIGVLGEDFAVQNPKGTNRIGLNPDGSAWNTPVAATYGSFDKFPSTDGDGTDAFVGDSDPDACPVFVINQHKVGEPTVFDECKAMLGFTTWAEAEAAYLGSFDGLNLLMSHAEMPAVEFLLWLQGADKSVPVPTQETAPTMDTANANTPVDASRQSDTAEALEGAAQATAAGTEDAEGSDEVKLRYGVKSTADAVADVPCATCGNPIEFWKKYCTDCRGNFTKSELDEKGVCPDCGCEYGGDSTHCERCGYRPDTTDSASMLDAVLLSELHYYVVGDDGEAITDAGKIPPKENGPLKVSLLASLANKRNANGRFFTPGFMRKVAKTATQIAKTSPCYGLEPHPAFNDATGQYDHKSEDEIWQCLSWHADSQGNLWNTVLVDETTPKGSRAGTKIRRKEKLGVSVRWTPYAHLVKHGKLADGQEVQYFDDEVADAGFTALALDAVPNPAFPEAGHAMFDCEGTCSLPITDAALLAAEPLVNLTTLDNETIIPDAVTDAAPCGCQSAQDTTSTELTQPDSLADSAGDTPANPPLDSEATSPSAAVADNAASEADTNHPTPSRGTQTASPRGSEKRKQMVKPLTDADIKKMSKRDRKASLRSMLDALKSVEDDDQKAVITANADALSDAMDDDDDEMEDAAKAKAAIDAQAKVDAEKAAVADALAQMKELKAELDAAKARKEAEAKAQEVAAFVDAVKAGTASELDLARFDEDDRALLATAANGKASVADAKTAIEGQIAILDMVNAKHKRAAMGMADNGAAGVTVADDTRTEAKVEVTLDAGDKAVEHLYGELDAAMDKIRRKQGLATDKELSEYNKSHFIKEVREKNGLNKPEVKKAVADSAMWLLADSEGKKRIDINASRKAVVDAGLVAPAPLTDSAAVTNNSTLLNQASIANFFMERSYQYCGSLQYLGGVSEGTLMRVPGANAPVGQVLRIPTFARNNAPHDYFMDLNGMVVGESQGIPNMGVYDSFQDWPVIRRRLGTTISRDSEMSIMHGPLNQIDPVAFSLSQMTDEFQISTDNTNYVWMSRASDEINAKKITSETVATGNIAYSAGGSVIQDGVAYGANVTAAVQIAPGINPGTIRDSGLSGTASASADFMVPICYPRTVPSLGATGVIANVVKNPISATIGGTAVVFGYLDATKNIQSYVGTTATAAVDFANGKIVFTTGVTGATTTLVINYSAVTNISYIRSTFSAGYPNSLTQAEYTQQVLTAYDTAGANLASAPNFMVPDTLLTTVKGSVAAQNASNFFQFVSPVGTTLGTTKPIPGVYAHRTELDYCKENAQLPWGDNTALIFQRGTVRFGVDKPFTIEGPFPSYDVTTGDITEDNKYRGSEYGIWAAPLPIAADGVTVLNYYYTKVKSY